MILEVFPCGPLGTNAILIGCEETKEGIFIDPSPGSASFLLEAAERHQLKIEAIYLTHSHWDHTADISQLQEELPLDVYVHPLDADNVKNPGSDKIPLLMKIKAPNSILYIHDNEERSVGDLKFKVLHTPGHCPGAVCFYFEKEHVLISGDTLFRGTIGTLSLPTGEPEKMWSSLERLASLPKETKVYPGHGSSTTIGRESWLENAKELFG